ncbi:MAG: acyl-CoA thioesterase [Hydrogenobacter thermophilus]|nr:acyl-CoA thioesterase [Hydrogenobacter thermophilus]
MKHTYVRRVQFYETDAQGIVHHSNYFKYFEEARGDLLRSAGLAYSQLRKEGYEVVLLEAFCKYKKPLFYDEEVHIEVSLTHMDRFTFSFDYRVVVQRELRATAYTKHCLLKNSKLYSIPDKIKEVLTYGRKDT